VKGRISGNGGVSRELEGTVSMRVLDHKPFPPAERKRHNSENGNILGQTHEKRRDHRLSKISHDDVEVGVPQVAEKVSLPKKVEDKERREHIIWVYQETQDGAELTEKRKEARH